LPNAVLDRKIQNCVANTFC